MLGPLLAAMQVRSHAVSVLQQKEDDELLSYLLQLVQVRPRSGAGCEAVDVGQRVELLGNGAS